VVEPAETTGKGFDTEAGNVLYSQVEHEWKDGRCVWCGASEAAYSRGEERESHAYGFIHGKKGPGFWGQGIGDEMKFDVIIGNPPYQMSDGGAFASASPIYHRFVEQAKKMNPRYLIMIIPSRWFAGGKGLDEFRKEMLNDNHLRVIHDFPIGEECFPGIRLSGGVCYFRWERDNPGLCTVFNHQGGQISSKMERPLLEAGTDTFIRKNGAISIFRKVRAMHEKLFADIISNVKPYGLRTDFFNDPKKYGLPPVSEEPFDSGIMIYGLVHYKTVKRYIPLDYPVPSGKEYINCYKVFVSQVLDNGFDQTKERLKPFLGRPNEICTETFLRIGSFKDERTAKNVISYMNTKFFHILMFLKKISHHVVSKVYEYVPLQDFSEPWTDEKLYKKYGLTQEEIDFIETNVIDLEEK
jgi:site-specific DNA-methyltransferase (adenine-specific)